MWNAQNKEVCPESLIRDEPGVEADLNSRKCGQHTTWHVRTVEQGKSGAVENVLNARVASETASSAATSPQGSVSTTSNSLCSCFRCQNFEALEDQLNNIQSDLSALTSLVKSGNRARSVPVAGEDWVLHDLTKPDGSMTTRKDSYIVRDRIHSVDRYHGPCSLYALCKEFHGDPIFETDESVDDGSTTRVMLRHMLSEASKEQYLDIPSGSVGTSLPPRQFLNIVVGQFFKNADYATDMFVRPSFQAHLDRIYSQPLRSSDDGWAVCFNVIVLLAIGRDQTNQGSSPFIQPFLQTLRMAVNNPRVFLTPRLVNVQALSLLSYVAEQYSTTGLAEIVFAQACLLARTMGLHQYHASLSDVSLDEIVERQKLFRSLYIRDRNSVTCRGSISWLPGHDSSTPERCSASDGEETRYSSRMELAKIQDEVYQSLLKAQAPELPHSKHSRSLSQLKLRLDQWAATNQITKTSTMPIESATLMLSFLATRLCISRGRDESKLAHEAFEDAKASCLVFLLATTAQPDPRLAEALDQLLGRTHSSSPMSENDAQEMQEQSSQRQAMAFDEDEIMASMLPRLAAHFPLAAVFIVARGILLQPMTASDGLPRQPEEEILLLEALRDRYASAADQEHVESLALKLSRTLESLVRIVRQRKLPEAVNTPSMVFNELSSLQSTASSSSQRGSVGSSLKDTPPGPGTMSAAVSTADAVSNSSLLLPFMQPLDSSTDCSPWLGNAGHGTSGPMVLSPWPEPYKQHSDGTVRAGKRPRLSSHVEVFDIASGYTDHGPRADDDPLFTFDFLAAGNDMHVFEVEE
ncbi:hypothetical protein FZEAL_1949 [Fusarium zealandicum]|uniref:Xylanolytic transcriptional activator regulatory domain-containing protein n=1 Tax=Fusarium zealandicum TaxID=1053134 RepID=A0A8H4URR9_9HYPO|nr:hypothetical protein FZEAL_1949 [Fusarium zealandicum]